MKFLLTTLFLLLQFYSFSQIVFPIQKNKNEVEQNLKEIAAHYFNVDPYGKSLKDLIDEMESQLAFHVDTLILNTDTSSFYLRGYSEKFNPFSFPIKKFEVQIRETKVFVTKKDKKPADSFLVIHMIAATDSTLQGKEYVKQEYERLFKKLNPLFQHSDPRRSGKKDLRDYRSCCYYYSFYPSPQVCIFWGGHYENYKINVFSIQLLLGGFPKTNEQ